MPTSSIKFKFDPTFLRSLKATVSEEEVAKFDLFLISREIEQTTQELTRISFLPDSKKQVWFEENEALVRLFMNDLISEVKDIFFDLTLNSNNIKEAMGCVSKLKELIAIIDQLLTTEAQFEVELKDSDKLA